MDMQTNLKEKLKKGPPYKLLALDGGGIRGLITIEILANIERTIQKLLGKNESFVLADYFDYVAGTSTGAVIGSCVSLGMRVSDIRRLYLESAELMFDKTTIFNRLRFKFNDEPLAKKLKFELRKKIQENLKGEGYKIDSDEEPTLGSSGLKTLLMMVMRNATTDSPWPVTNNPEANYNDSSRLDCNLNLPLWQLVRASTAAPVYFPPEQITVGDNNFLFVDGGVTMYNNPAFQLFLMSTLPSYKVNWKVTKPEDMLLVSIGTGTSPQPNGALKSEDMNILFNAAAIPSALMFAALNEQDFLCRVFGKCLSGDVLDRELGDLIGKDGPISPKCFTYVRYNAELTREGLSSLGKTAGVDLTAIDPNQVQKLDSVAYKDQLMRIGEAVASHKVKESHYSGFL